jgi:hypothetical protein
MCVAERDYTKFLKDEDRLNIRLIPRAAYVEMVTRHRHNPAVVESVFEDLYLLWDLNDAAEKAAAAGRDVSRVELADELIGELADDDWWKTIAAFEEHLMRTFHENPSAWAELLDPVYDTQERDGWIQRQ